MKMNLKENKTMYKGDWGKSPKAKEVRNDPLFDLYTQWPYGQ